MNGIRRILIFFFMVLCLCGCSSTVKAQETETETYYFLTMQTLDDIQVWQVALDGSGGEMIHSVPSWSGKIPSAENSLFDNEIFENELGQALLAKYSDPAALTNFYSYLNINVSPDKNYIAYNERYEACPGNWCDGLYVMRVFDLQTNLEVMTYLADTPMSFRDWSGDSKQIVFEQLDDYLRPFTYTIHVWDVENNREVLTVEGEDSEFVGDTTGILARFYVRDGQGGEIEKNCCKLVDTQSKIQEAINLSQGLEYGKPALSHDGNRLAIVYDQEGFSGIKFINLKNGKDDWFTAMTIPADVNRFEWSYDDQYIGLGYQFDIDLKLDIVNRKTGDTRTSIKSVRDWDWSETSNRLIYLSDSEKAKSCVQQNVSISVFDVVSGGTQKLPLPDEVSAYMMEYKDTWICIQFIREVDW